jgi:hypothetical protein
MLMKHRATAALAFTLTLTAGLAYGETCAQLMGPKGRGLNYWTLKAALQQVVPANSAATTPNGRTGVSDVVNPGRWNRTRVRRGYFARRL